MFDEAPDQRVPKLVTVRLPSWEVNRKSGRNRVIFFPLEYFFFSENILAKMKYENLAKSSVLEQKIKPFEPFNVAYTQD